MWRVFQRDQKGQRGGCFSVIRGGSVAGVSAWSEGAAWRVFQCHQQQCHMHRRNRTSYCVTSKKRMTTVSVLKESYKEIKPGR